MAYMISQFRQQQGSRSIMKSVLCLLSSVGYISQFSDFSTGFIYMLVSCYLSSKCTKCSQQLIPVFI